jgi:hypothetical protein
MTIAFIARSTAGSRAPANQRTPFTRRFVIAPKIEQCPTTAEPCGDVIGVKPQSLLKCSEGFPWATHPAQGRPTMRASFRSRHRRDKSRWACCASRGERATREWSPRCRAESRMVGAISSRTTSSRGSERPVRDNTRRGPRAMGHRGMVPAPIQPQMRRALCVRAHALRDARWHATHDRPPGFQPESIDRRPAGGRCNFLATPGASDHPIAAWQDHRSGAGDIYAQQIAPAMSRSISMTCKAGRCVSSWVGDSKHEGTQQNGLNDGGSPAANGVYFYRFEAGGAVLVRRFVKVR